MSVMSAMRIGEVPPVAVIAADCGSRGRMSRPCRPVPRPDPTYDLVTRREPLWTAPAAAKIGRSTQERGAPLRRRSRITGGEDDLEDSHGRARPSYPSQGDGGGRRHAGHGAVR